MAGLLCLGPRAQGCSDGSWRSAQGLDAVGGRGGPVEVPTEATVLRRPTGTAEAATWSTWYKRRQRRSRKNRRRGRSFGRRLVIFAGLLEGTLPEPVSSRDPRNSRR